ncbi:DUF4251 domain-containing protein [Geojedonia litorea]|uniref:DUF4251 domain-containing protein n=1 Tax=Geojedonia litorea TaxID=1268269 RepID=A0ABV9N355_9FLAO
MKSLPTYISILLLTLLVGCASSNARKSPENLKAYEDLKQLVNSKHFNINSRRALPAATLAMTAIQNANLLAPGNNAGSIDITGNQNFLRVEGDSVFAFLPFFGEQRIGGSYPGNTHIGIEFKGIPKNYELEFDDDKLKTQIKFSINDQYRHQESYDVYINVFAGRTSDVRVLSSTRSSMAYQGTIEPIDKNKKP